VTKKRQKSRSCDLGSASEMPTGTTIFQYLVVFSSAFYIIFHWRE